MDWLTYSFADFVPITEAVYQRLPLRVNQHWWPGPPFAWLLTLIALILRIKGDATKTANLVVGALWGWLGYGFFWVFYQPLIWAGGWFAMACWLQLGLLWLLGFAPVPSSLHPWRWWSGSMLCALGIGWPLIGLLETDRPAQWPGFHPDPTAVFCLGWILLVSSGWTTWLLSLVPLLWCTWSLMMAANFYF